MVACGDIGTRLAAVLGAEDWHCLGLRRSPEVLPPALEPVRADLSNVDTLRVLVEREPQLLLFTPTPTERSVAGYERGFAQAARNIVSALDGFVPARVFLVSSTRVYAERDGGMVDESGVLNRDDATARAIIAAEEAFLEALPTAVVLRAGRLYGNGPGYLLRRVRSGELTPREPLRYSNRIHRDDLVGFMHYLLEHAPRERIYNLVDDACVPQQEVERWMCEQLDLPYQPADQQNGALRGHKRISNERLRDSGYALHYADYRAGYRAAIEALSDVGGNS